MASSQPLCSTPELRIHRRAVLLALSLAGCVGTIDPPGTGDAGSSLDQGGSSLPSSTGVANHDSTTGSTTPSTGSTSDTTTWQPVADPFVREAGVPSQPEDGGGLPIADGRPDATAPGEVDSGPAPEPCELPEEAPLAADLRLSEVAVYQAVKVPLMQDAQPVSDLNAPLIQGRKALVRAFVTPLVGFVQRDVVALLRVENEDDVTLYDALLKPTLASDDPDLSSTFNFDVPGEDIGPSTRISLSLHETSCNGESADPRDARFPEAGEYVLNALNTGVMKVKLVPVRYRANGADVVASTAPDTVARMRDALLSMYPVSDVQVSVREAFEWTQPVAPGGSGWEVLLNEILRLRDEEAGGSGEYYYGLVKTASSFRDYCSYGCVAGIAPVPLTGDFWGGPRVTGGIGVGYDDDYSRVTAVHELGHAHGRNHSPCEELGGIDGVDQSYPYDGGGIGSWGYDLLSGQLKPPVGTDGYVDVMGYCDPVWVSDYTYRAWAEWAADANLSARIVALDDERKSTSAVWRSLIVFPDGKSRWGTWQPTQPPAGRMETAQLLDAQGTPVEEVLVVRMPLSDSDSEFVFIASLSAEGVVLSLSDRVIDLRETRSP